MTFSLSPALGRAVALLILVALVLLAWFAGATPLIGMVAERRSDIDRLQKRLNVMQATIARIPERERRGDELKAALDAAGGVWIGSSDAAIAAALQDKLRQVVTGSEGTFKSASYLGATAEKNLQTIRIRLSAEGTLDTLHHTLAAMETAQPPMFVDGMVITAPAQFAADKPPILALDFEISAFMRKTEE